MASKKKKGSKNGKGTTEASLLVFYTRLSLDCRAIASYLKKPKGKSSSSHTVQNAVLDDIWIRQYLKPIIARIQSHTCTGIHIIFAAMKLLHCSAWQGTWVHECIQSRRTTRWPHYCITELQTGPTGLTTRQICTEANTEQPPSSPRSITVLPILTLWEVVRRVQVHQVLQFSLWTAHKIARCCPSPTPCHILSPPTSSWRCAFTTYWDPLIQLQRGLSLPSGPLLSSQGHYIFRLPQVLFLSPRRHKPTRDLGQRWPPHATTNALARHSLLPAAHSHLVSSFQHPGPRRWSNLG